MLHHPYRTYALTVGFRGLRMGEVFENMPFLRWTIWTSPMAFIWLHQVTFLSQVCHHNQIHARNPRFKFKWNWQL